jgi:hypothetical protein
MIVLAAIFCVTLAAVAMLAVDEALHDFSGVDNRGGHPNEAVRGSLPRPAGLRASSGESHPTTDCTGGVDAPTSIPHIPMAEPRPPGVG